MATIDLAVTDGDTVPNVNAGDVLEAHQSAVAPFRAHPGCGAPGLLAAAFR